MSVPVPIDLPSRSKDRWEKDEQISRLPPSAGRSVVSSLKLKHDNAHEKVSISKA